MLQRNAPIRQASWSGLLEDGLAWLKEHKLIDDDVADAQLKLLKTNPRTHRFISAAEDVTAGLGGAQSPHFADWLQRTIGSIKANDESLLEVLDAIRQQGHLIATTNYDGLLLNSYSSLTPITWQETDALIGLVRHWDTNKIIFLHGYWRKPESVILDWKSYERIARDERYREDLAAFWKTNIWVYVGCGVNGLGDPDFGLLLERYGERARQADHWDYCLVRNDQREEFQAHFDTNKLNIRAIAFGKDNADLPDYLRSLLPPIVVSEGGPASAEAKTSTRASKIRSLYLKDARRDFEGRLKASIHHARFIDLGIQDDPAAIKPAWGYHDPETRKTYDTVAEAFAGSDHRLLLLGHPGSGKTTGLLHLANLLVDEAEKDLDAPIPFLVNLSKFRFERSEDRRPWFIFGKGSSWTTGNDDKDINRKFEDWLVSEMAAFPGLSRDLAREWIHQGRVAALLDGLDEFNDERRADLVRLLNSTFLRDYPDLIVVVCSRTNEYLVLRSSEETRLQLRGCVHLQPLSDEQIAVYLEAAQAGALLSALPDDPALHELARTPLTLSMLVLAYGGLAPKDLPSSGSLSESRHHLFESYVDRMLQRRERRKRGIPFDNLRANDVPISEYSYHPDKVHRWLGWLALALSVRMRTTFSVANFHSILSIGVEPIRQPFNFVAVYMSVGVLLSVSLCLVALPIVPITSVALLSTLFIVLLVFILLPVAAGGGKNWTLGQLFLIIGFPTVILFVNAALARLLSGILPGTSSLAISSILPFGILIAIIIADSGFEEDSLKASIGWLGVVGVIIGLPFLTSNWVLPFFDVSWWQTGIATVLFSLVLASVIADTDPLRDKITVFGGTIGISAVFVFATWLFPEPTWITSLVAIGASLVLILAVVKVPTAVLVLLGCSLFALSGGLVAEYPGAILFVAVFGLMCALGLGERTWFKNRRIEKLESRSKIVADQTFRLFEEIFLSPCLWLTVALARRFSWHRDRFISFCKEAFLLKQSSQEYEFIHRLLRDYFALRELRPRLAASDKQRRLDAIRFLGYQGEAALDVLTEFTSDQDPSVRAAALTGLSHISSPIVTRLFERHLDDRNPLVRQAIIPGIFRLPEETAKQLLSRLQPLGDGCELNPLLDSLQTQNTYRSEINTVIYRLGNTALDPLKGRLKNRNKRVRLEALGVLAQFLTPSEQKLLSTRMDGVSPWLDPAKPISRSRVVECARESGYTEETIIARYQDLADKIGLKIKL